MISLISILMFLLAAAIAYYFLSGFIWGAGYAPTSGKEIDKVAKLLELKKDDTFYDLGCGYGRMIIAMAQRYNVKCVGIEIDPIKCWWIRFMIKQKKLEGRVTVVHSDFLKVNLEEVQSVFIFLSKVTNIMKVLQEKMFREMKPGARVVSYTHRFDDWTPDQKIGGLYLYSISEKAKVEKK